MGTKGRAIVGTDADRLVELLNRALADEWLAYYQYWLGAKVVAGPMKDAAIAEMIQHATDEQRHAEMVSNRIIQLGGTPLTTPKRWFDVSNCDYDEPLDPYVEKILEQNIKAEQCAISVYHGLTEDVGMKDPVTYNMASQILQDEVEHEEDLQALLEDLKMMLERRA